MPAMHLRQLLFAIASLALGIAVVTLVITCIPRPEDEIDYLELPETIVVQKKSVDMTTSLGTAVESACTTPQLTLYGDGTLLIAPNGNLPVMRTGLDENDIRDILDAADDDGFFDFDYEQRAREGEPRSLTFVYVHTQSEANAVAIEDAGLVPEGEALADYRAAVSFAERLDGLGGRADAAAPLADARYVLEAVLFGGEPTAPVQPWTGPSTPGQIAAGQSVFVGEPGSPGPPQGVPTGFVAEGEDVYYVCARPALPYEENFPEFDSPTP